MKKDLLMSLKSLLGESPDSILFRSFCSEFGSEPTVQRADRQRIFSFPGLGIRLPTFNGLFEGIIFHISTPATRSNYFEPYTGALPNNISVNDSRELVQQKLGRPPISSERIAVAALKEREIRDLYDMESYYISFTFNTSTKLMSTVFIVLAPPKNI